MSADKLPSLQRSTDAPAPRSLAHVDTWIFDLDDTLYPASCNLFVQVSRRIGDYISKTLDVPFEQARELQLAYYRQFGTTLSGLINVDKLAPEPFLEYVYDIDLSGVAESPDLRASIAALPGRRIIFTNSSRRHAENVANRLGVLDLFDDICDIASLYYEAKPARNAYDRLLKMHSITASQAAMFEDLPHNLEVPFDLGMTTVLVYPDKVDHPGRIKMSDWQEVPTHVDYLTADLTTFLKNKIVGPRELSQREA